MLVNLGISKLKAKLRSGLNILRSTSKPSRSEFWLLFKVCVIGITLIGLIGFLIMYVFALVGLFS